MEWIGIIIALLSLGLQAYDSLFKKTFSNHDTPQNTTELFKKKSILTTYNKKNPFAINGTVVKKLKSLHNFAHYHTLFLKKTQLITSFQ